MQFVKKIKRYTLGIMLLGMNISLGGCGDLTSPVDQAYYTGGSVFSIPGGYTRTIFSTNNF